MTAFQRLGSCFGSFSFECEKHGLFTAQCLVGRDGQPVYRQAPRCPACAAEKEAFRAAHPEMVAAEERERQAAIQAAKAEEERKAAQAAAEERQRAMEGMLKRSRIPAEYLGKTFDGYKPQTPENAEALRQVRLYAQNFSRIREKGVGLFLYGTTGTGKSHLACALLQTLMPEVDSAYVMTWEVIKMVKEADLHEDPLRPFINASLLVLDEIGVQAGTRFEETVLYQLIDSRVAAHRPTIIITNVQPDSEDEARATVRKCVGERLWDRLQWRSVFLRFTGKSFRKRFASVDQLIVEAF